MTSPQRQAASTPERSLPGSPFRAPPLPARRTADNTWNPQTVNNTPFSEDIDSTILDATNAVRVQIQEAIGPVRSRLRETGNTLQATHGALHLLMTLFSGVVERGKSLHEALKEDSARRLSSESTFCAQYNKSFEEARTLRRDYNNLLDTLVPVWEQLGATLELPTALSDADAQPLPFPHFGDAVEEKIRELVHDLQTTLKEAEDIFSKANFNPTLMGLRNPSVVYNKSNNGESADGLGVAVAHLQKRKVVPSATDDPGSSHKKTKLREAGVYTSFINANALHECSRVSIVTFLVSDVFPVIFFSQTH